MLTLDQYLAIRDLSLQGVTQSEIARRTGLDRKTIRKYLVRSVGPPVKRRRQSSGNLVQPHSEYLRKRWAQGCHNAVVLMREIKEKGYRGSYSVLKEFLHPLRGGARWRVELRWESPPGQYAQADWGHFKAELPDGSSLKLYAFVFTLAYSRVIHVEWTTGMDLATLERCHEHAFAYVGGVSKYVVYDRMRTVVLGEDSNGQVRFHPEFLDFARHYGFTPKAAPAYWPRGKGKVESSVKYLRHNFWEGLTSIAGVEDLNVRCRDWLDDVANKRNHGTTGRIPCEALKEEGLTSLAARAPYPISPAVERIVSHDCLVSYSGCRYSVPAEWAGKPVWVRQVSGDRVVVSAGGTVIIERPLEPVLRRTVLDPEHYASLIGRPRYHEVKPVPRIEPPLVDVERRSLAEYQALVEVVR
jgi:transposase